MHVIHISVTLEIIVKFAAVLVKDFFDWTVFKAGRKMFVRITLIPSGIFAIANVCMND